MVGWNYINKTSYSSCCRQHIRLEVSLHSGTEWDVWCSVWGEIEGLSRFEREDIVFLSIYVTPPHFILKFAISSSINTQFMLRSLGLFLKLLCFISVVKLWHMLVKYNKTVYHINVHLDTSHCYQDLPRLPVWNMRGCGHG